MGTQFLSELPKVKYGSLSLDVKGPSTYVLFDEVTLECPPNYMPSRDPISGKILRTSIVMENLLGELFWSLPELECGLSTLPCIEKGRCFSKQSPPFREGDTATVSCWGGYETQYPEIKVISHEGSLIWNKTNPCEPGTLAEPPQAIHGTFVLPPGPYPLGTQATLQCDEDYETSNTTSTVQWTPRTQTLAWWPNPLECYRNKCPPPPPGFQQGGEREIGSRVEYTCSPGYDLLGAWNGSLKPVMNPYQSQCSALGQWQPDLPEKFECAPIHCPEPEKILYGVTLFFRHEGGLATYKCFDKSVPIVTRVCQANGLWSGSTPTCPYWSNQSTLKMWIPIIVLIIASLITILQMIRGKNKISNLTS